jgi:hypothetical protein
MQTPANKLPTNFDYDVASESTSAKIRGVAQKLAAAFAAGDAKAADELFSNHAVYLDRALRVRTRGRLGKYLSRVLATISYGSGAKLERVVATRAVATSGPTPRLGEARLRRRRPQRRGTDRAARHDLDNGVTSNADLQALVSSSIEK